MKKWCSHDDRLTQQRYVLLFAPHTPINRLFSAHSPVTRQSCDIGRLKGNRRRTEMEIREGDRRNVRACVQTLSLLWRDGEQGWMNGWRRWQMNDSGFRCRWRHLCCFSPGWCWRRRWGRSLPRRSASSPSSSHRLCPPRWCTEPVMERGTG